MANNSNPVRTSSRWPGPVATSHQKAAWAYHTQESRSLVFVPLASTATEPCTSRPTSQILPASRLAYPTSSHLSTNQRTNQHTNQQREVPCRRCKEQGHHNLRTTGTTGTTFNCGLTEIRPPLHATINIIRRTARDGISDVHIQYGAWGCGSCVG